MTQDNWQKDILDGFEMKYVEQTDDRRGAVRCAVVRKLAESSSKAAVYIHGFSDYFFQADMAREFVSHGYSFYAVDLRRYGRSLLPGQKPFVVRDLREYFPDIDAAIDAAKADGSTEIILMGHSTGGLTSALYMQEQPDPAVRALILNSPFLAWNIRSAFKRALMHVVAALGRIIPGIPVDSGGTIDYHRSLSRSMGGEWDFDRRWKPDIMPNVDAGWVRAIESGQRRAVRGGIRVPVLLLHSDKSAWHGDGAEAFSKSDGVLDVKKIAAAGRRIGDNVDEVTIRDGLHDLVLSRPDVRRHVFSVVFSWLDSHSL